MSDDTTNETDDELAAFSWLVDRTPEEIAEADRVEAADRQTALDVLMERLLAAGAPAEALAAVMPAIAEVLNPRLDRSHGVLLEGGILTPLYGFHHIGIVTDPEHPQHAESRRVWEEAQAAARHYHAVRLSTSWIEGEIPRA